MKWIKMTMETVLSEKQQLLVVSNSYPDIVEFGYFDKELQRIVVPDGCCSPIEYSLADIRYYCTIEKPEEKK